MSYNINRFKLEKVSLILPKGFSFKEFSDRAWNEVSVSSDLRSWDYNWRGEGLQMRGEVTGRGLEVEELSCWGEGSGHDYYDLLIPLFEKFQGDLEASLVWEGGDSITRNSIVKGKATEEEIEI